MLLFYDVRQLSNSAETTKKDEKRKRNEDESLFLFA